MIRRAADIAGHAFTRLSPRSWNACIELMSAVSIPIRSFSTPASRSTSTTESAMRPTIIGSAPSAQRHVNAGRMLPFSQGASSFEHSKSEPTVSNSTGSPSRGRTA